MNYAGLNGAMNLDLDRWPDVGIHLNTTIRFEGATARLTSGDNLLWEQDLDIGPAEPFSKDITLQEMARPETVTLELHAEDGEVILEYTPEQHAPSEMPDPVRPPPPPKEFETVEELYLAGLRLNQFYNAQLDPTPYYEEALRRDPGNYMVNTQLGILSCKAFRWKEAEKQLRLAIERSTWNHTRPRDGEAWYYLGISLREQGNMQEAYDAFYRATWSMAWHAASFYQLAEMDCRTGSYDEYQQQEPESLEPEIGDPEKAGKT
jgi:tetratricopeptide (TPR) repeat protein